MVIISIIASMARSGVVTARRAAAVRRGVTYTHSLPHATILELDIDLHPSRSGAEVEIELVPSRPFDVDRPPIRRRDRHQYQRGTMHLIEDRARTCSVEAV
ncbi:MAG: hypothetical protein P8N02_01235 [Actinomycetota bacterium]|nr:hypothetical protein [Actinomycetota bacterium]